MRYNHINFIDKPMKRKKKYFIAGREFPQRVRDGVSRMVRGIRGMERYLIWAVEGMVKRNYFFLSIHDVRHTLVAGDMKVSCKCTGHSVNQGGTADDVYSPLTELMLCQGFFCSLWEFHFSSGQSHWWIAGIPKQRRRYL